MALAVGATALGLVLGAPAPANATGTVDQSQTTTSGLSVTAAASRWVAQTFTAGITGALDQVDVFIWRIGSPGDLTLTIETASDGTPSGVVRGSATLPQTSVSDSFGWVSFPLSPGVQVTAGTQYAIVLSAPTAAGFPDALYVWNYVFGSPYAGGKLVLSGTSGSTWGDFASVFDDGDAAFRTYVTPVPTSLAQCLDGGWRNFAAFKNEGDCVSFVASAGRNQPG